MTATNEAVRPNEVFEERLLKSLGRLRTLNFRHIAFLGRELDKLSNEKAYRILWHEEEANR